jgi:hypothetical protein
MAKRLSALTRSQPYESLKRRGRGNRQGPSRGDHTWLTRTDARGRCCRSGCQDEEYGWGGPVAHRRQEYDGKSGRLLGCNPFRGMAESMSGLSDPFLGCPARRTGPFGLRRGAARARRRIFNAPAGSHLAISIIPTAPMLRLSAEPHLSKTDAKFDAAGVEKWRLFFPGGPDDPDTIFVRMNVDRIELCVRGVTLQSPSVHAPP